MRLIQGDCLEVLPTLPAASIDLILTDPPYMNVKRSESWDRQWKTPAEYLDWIGRLCGEWRRILKPNGSLYCFASPQMAARVECRIAESFEVLNSIVWNKLSDYDPGDMRATAYKARDHGSFRRYFDYSERIIFAEQHGADSMALGESGYAAQCERLRGFVFEPLRIYLASEFAKAAWDADDLNRICGTASMAGRHYTARSQWCLPTAIHYAKLQKAAPRGILRRDYEDLRREYEDLRRPFTVSAHVPYTDVWDFATVPSRPGKHVCAKPEPLIEHMIRASTRPGATVLDCFMGGGTTGVVSAQLGLSFIGIERDEGYFRSAKARIEAVQPKHKVAV